MIEALYQATRSHSWSSNAHTPRRQCGSVTEDSILVQGDVRQITHALHLTASDALQNVSIAIDTGAADKCWMQLTGAGLAS